MAQRLVKHDIIRHTAIKQARQRDYVETIATEVAEQGDLGKCRALQQTLMRMIEREQQEIDRLTDLLPLPREASE